MQLKKHPRNTAHLHLRLVVEVEVRQPVFDGVPQDRHVLCAAATYTGAGAIAGGGTNHGGGNRLGHDVFEMRPRLLPGRPEVSVPHVVVVEDVQAFPALFRLRT